MPAKDILDLQGIFQELRGETSERLSRYTQYLDWYRGNSELYTVKSDGRPQHKTNMCDRAVEMLANFTLSEMPEIHAMRASETMTRPIDPAEYETDLSKSEMQEKIIRRVFNAYTYQGRRELSSGMNTGLVLGDAVYHIYMDDDKVGLPKIQSIFPGHVRMKFKSNDYLTPSDAFVTNVVTTQEIKRRFGVEVAPVNPETDADYSSIWDSSLLFTAPNYTLLTTHYDEKYRTRYSGNILIDQVEHNMPGTPIMSIPAFLNPFSPWGRSYLVDIIPINKEYNEGISDEAAIVRMFSHPKVIIRNATQKDIDMIRAMWKTGVIASRNDLQVQPFQFGGQIFPVEQRITKIEERYFRSSGLGPATFGMPPGSINTGASLTVQFAPTLQKGQIVWQNWEPRLLKMIDFIIETLIKNGGVDPDSKKTYKEIFTPRLQYNLVAPFRMPRDEAISIANELQKYSQGLQSRYRTMTNLGIESPEDELTLRTWEDIVLAQMLPEKVKPQQPTSSPTAGAELGGQTVANAAIGIPPPAPLSQAASTARASQYLSNR